MRGLSKRTRMAFSFFEYLLSFQRYSSSCSKIDVTNCISTKINHKILNISGNIGVMLLTLGTNNVCQVSNKLTPTLTLPWYYSWPQTLSAINWHTVLLETHKVPIFPASPHQLTGSKQCLIVKLLSWQRHSRCHFVSYQKYIYWCQV